MDFCKIKAFEEYKDIEAFYTYKNWNNWPCNEPDNTEGFEGVARLFGIRKDDMVRIPQKHTSNVRVITKENAGEGITKTALEGYDGMVTNVPGIMMCTVEADCVPVYIYDPQNKAIGMIHSGWKGTAGLIAAKAVSLMKETYGTNPEDVIVCFGPCICGKCYEVSDDLIPHFLETYTKEQTESFFTPKENSKYMLDLVEAITTSLCVVGVKRSNIFEPDSCTLEDERLCSWRRDADPKARMLTAIMLKNDR